MSGTTPNETAPRLLVVSNRLPITCTRTAEGIWQFKKSSGGLVAALSGVKEKYSAFVWIGWVGCEVPKEEQQVVAKQLWSEELCVPGTVPPPNFHLCFTLPSFTEFL